MINYLQSTQIPVATVYTRAVVCRCCLTCCFTHFSCHVICSVALCSQKRPL